MRLYQPHQPQREKRKKLAYFKYVRDKANSSFLFAISNISIWRSYFELLDHWSCSSLTKMSSARFFLYCLMLLTGDSVWSKGCRWMQFQLSSKNEECVSLLYQMVRIFWCPNYLFCFPFCIVISNVNVMFHRVAAFLWNAWMKRERVFSQRRPTKIFR